MLSLLSFPGSCLVTHCLGGSRLPVLFGNPKRERADRDRSSLAPRVGRLLGRREPAGQWVPRREPGNQEVER